MANPGLEECAFWAIIICQQHFRWLLHARLRMHEQLVHCAVLCMYVEAALEGDSTAYPLGCRSDNSS